MWWSRVQEVTRYRVGTGPTKEEKERGQIRSRNHKWTRKVFQVGRVFLMINGRKFTKERKEI